MGASDFSTLPHHGESYKRKESYRFLCGAGQYTDDIRHGLDALHEHGVTDFDMPASPARIWDAIQPAKSP